MKMVVNNNLVNAAKKKYESLVAKMPDTIDWNGLKNIEVEDTTTGSQELSCTGEVCEVVDIGA